MTSLVTALESRVVLDCRTCWRSDSVYGRQTGGRRTEFPKIDLPTAALQIAIRFAIDILFNLSSSHFTSLTLTGSIFGGISKLKMSLEQYLQTDDLTVLLGLIAVTVFLLRNLYKPQPLVHPILLGRQSDVGRVRNSKESTLYRNYGTGLTGRVRHQPSPLRILAQVSLD